MSIMSCHHHHQRFCTAAWVLVKWELLPRGAMSPNFTCPTREAAGGAGWAPKTTPAPTGAEQGTLCLAVGAVGTPGMWSCPMAPRELQGQGDPQQELVACPHCDLPVR